MEKGFVFKPKYSSYIGSFVLEKQLF